MVKNGKGVVNDGKKSLFVILYHSDSHDSSMNQESVQHDQQSTIISKEG